MKHKISPLIHEHDWWVLFIAQEKVQGVPKEVYTLKRYTLKNKFIVLQIDVIGNLSL